MSRKESDTRARILKACWDLLELGDPDGVRMADIAKRAGISRQALYLHFPKRAEVLSATTRYIDEVKDVEARLAASRAAATGAERLEAFIEAWGGYIPDIHGVARALIAMRDRDAEAAAAWDDRMDAVRDGCRAAVAALDSDGKLKDGLTKPAATDVLAMLLTVENWAYLRQARGWSQKRYIETIKALAHAALVRE